MNGPASDLWWHC